jgi:hypothetical protein
MDIPGLKAELEQHLKRNPHPDAAAGFRDRFEQAVEHYQAETEAEDKSQLEEQLKRIRDEAEAAANAAVADEGGPAAGDEAPSGEESPGDEAPAAGRGPGRGRIGVILAALAAAAAAAFYFYSGSG